MKYTLFLLVIAFGLVACGGSDAPDSSDAAPASAASPSIELPVTSVDLGPVDAALATEGQGIFETRCTTCHKMEGRYVGPPLGDVVGQREPEYIMNMILAPEKMLQTDPTAQQMLAEYSVPMTNQNLTEEEARAILEYLRQIHEGA